MAAIIPLAETDETGYYAIHISGSWFGKFAVAAKKEDENLPHMSNQFYSDGNFQTATLTASHPTETVIVRLRDFFVWEWIDPPLLDLRK
jgi:hypothetical protein